MSPPQNVPGSQKARASSWRRKVDYVYVTFFIIHLVVMFMVDLVPLYPSSIKPAFLDQIRKFYIDTYQDKFFTEPPQWFFWYMVMEAVYHTPASIRIASGFFKDDPFTPVHLLIWAVQSFITTATCLVEVWSWDDRTVEQKYNISMLYGPYALLALLAGLDMYYRLRASLVKRKND